MPVSSRVEPLLHLYNKIADNHTQNMEPCISARAVNSSTLQITAAHGYGTLELTVTAGENWALFTLGDLSAWTADPVQKHLRVATLCPLDMCVQAAMRQYLLFCLTAVCCRCPSSTVACDQKHSCVGQNCGQCGAPWEHSIAAAPYTGGRFEGFRGSEGEYPDSAGFFTIRSVLALATTRTRTEFNVYSYAARSTRASRHGCLPRLARS